MSVALAALLLGDARLPVGGHTQSAGLEPAVLAGLGARDVPAYLEARLRSIATVDAAAACVTLRELRAGADLAEVYRHWAARTPSHVQRRAAEQAAQGYLRLLRRRWPGSASAAAVGAVPACRPMAIAGVATELGLDPLELARVLVHDEIQTITSAALKLLPLDPAITVEWALGVHPIAEAVAVAAASVDCAADIPCPSMPMLDSWAHHHAESNRRLFSA